jgi:hypothetical protein
MSLGTVLTYPCMEETVHEHPNIAIVRRALEVDTSGDQRDADIRQRSERGRRVLVLR